MVKKSKGRQKIEMAKMKNESNLQVTFSKRRSGLFKKASELCTLCAAEIAIIVFSPGKKVFSFGHPNVESVIDRFLNNDPSPPPPQQPNNMQLNEVCRNSMIRDLNNHLTQVMNHLESEKKKNEELKKIRENSKRPVNWWEEPIEGLDLAQAYEFKSNLENLKKAVTIEASKIFQANLHHQNFYVGGSSNAGFGVDDGNNINPGLDQFNQRRLVNMNALYNQNNILPNHPLMFGNNHYGNIAEGFIPQYSMNYRAPEYNQSQNLSFKEETTSENEHQHDGHPPNTRSDYY